MTQTLTLTPTLTRLAKYKGREQMLNPSIFNMRKVRAARLPSANGHASAAALAAALGVLAASYNGGVVRVRVRVRERVRERVRDRVPEG